MGDRDARCASRALLLIALAAAARAEDQPQAPNPPAADPAAGATAYRDLSLEQLMDVDVVTVTSVSRRPERLATSASAVQVITGEDIRRSGATNLPEALRLATNLEVLQVDSHDWAISARGFANTLSNKMLVMIDGRTVYTPLFAGVFWDMQDTLLADIERIEVISGPGAALWGANAVNGVISIRTKSAKDTQGTYVEGGGGTTVQGFEGVRHGWSPARDLYVRLYEKAFHRDDIWSPYGRDPHDQWNSGQGGFRADYDPAVGEQLTLQGDIFRGQMEQTAGGTVNAAGGNVLGRWTHAISDTSNTRLQLYYDNLHRNIPSSIIEDQQTLDLDFQHRFQPAPRNDVTWGLGYRGVHDDVQNAPQIAFYPPEVTYRWFSVFAQDEIAVVRDLVTLTLGSKVEHNHYTDYEVEPSGRLALRPDERQVLWTAVSRAVHTPSRLDRELYSPATPPYLLQGGDFTSEKVIAYELGYRIEPERRMAFQLSTFYNDYHDVRSVEQVAPPAPFPVVIGNGLQGHSYGAEAVIDGRVTDWARLRLGYTETRVRLRPKAGSTDTSNGSGESHDPEHQATLRLSLDPAPRWQLDANLRYVSAIENQDVPAYAELDLRLGWLPRPDIECSLVGQNLLHDHHPEFGAPGARQEVERSGYAKVAWSF